MSTILKIILCAIFLGIFSFVIFRVPYPNSLTQANLSQILAFFTSLFLALTFTLNIFLSFLLLSATLALGIIFLLTLKALDSFNIVTVALTVLAVGLLLSYFRKTRRSLTKLSKISKMTRLKKE